MFAWNHRRLVWFASARRDDVRPSAPSVVARAEFHVASGSASTSRKNNDDDFASRQYNQDMRYIRYQKRSFERDPAARECWLSPTHYLVGGRQPSAQSFDDHPRR